MAELTDAEKDAISHRGRAVAALLGGWLTGSASGCGSPTGLMRRADRRWRSRRSGVSGDAATGQSVPA